MGSLWLIFAVAAVSTQSFAGSSRAFYQTPCDGNWAGAPWCDLKKSFESRSAAIVENLTVSEKTRLLKMMDEGVPRLEIPSYIWWSEALHGACIVFSCNEFT